MTFLQVFNLNLIKNINRLKFKLNDFRKINFIKMEINEKK